MVLGGHQDSDFILRCCIIYYIKLHHEGTTEAGLQDLILGSLRRSASLEDGLKQKHNKKDSEKVARV